MTVLRKIDSLLALLLFPSIILHEYSHIVALRLLDINTEIEWALLQINDEKSRVIVEDHPATLHRILGLILAPYALLLPAGITAELAAILYLPGDTVRVGLAILLGIQGLGILIQAGPARHDIAMVFKTATVNSRWIERSVYVLTWLISVIFGAIYGVWAGSLIAG